MNTSFQLLLGKYEGGAIAGLYDKCVLSFVRNCRTVFQSGYTIPNNNGFLLLHILDSIWCFHCWVLAILIVVQCFLVLMCISLITCEASFLSFFKNYILLCYYNCPSFSPFATLHPAPPTASGNPHAIVHVHGSCV